MCTDCHINGTWESKEGGQLKISYEGGKPQSRGPSFLGGVEPFEKNMS